MIETFWRGEQEKRQVDIHLLPVWVSAGEENVLVESAEVHHSAPQNITEISSFLGVMPSDVVEAAVDVVDLNTNYVFYTRSLHKECAGIYDAWDKQEFLFSPPATSAFKITFTLRVNGPNRENELKSFFEGLVRVNL